MSHHTTQFNHLNNCKSVINDLFSSAGYWCMSHNEMLATRKSKLFDSNSYKRLTRNNQAYLRGMLDTLFNLHYRLLCWGWNIDGKFYSKYDQLPEAKRSDVTSQKIKGHHWYKKDTSKMFS